MPPTKKQKREAMPPEYVKGKWKIDGGLHPHWRKTFPDDEEDADGRGKIVQGLPGYGVWRRVPGFWKIWASDLGYIMTEGADRVRDAKLSGDYQYVNCNGNNDATHLLVCRAFHGRPTLEQVSGDHIDLKRSNNCAANLRWATWKEQIANQREVRKPQSTGEACIVWKVQGTKRGQARQDKTAYMTPVAGTEKRFQSLFAAATALNLNTGVLSCVFNNTRWTVPNADGERFTGRWDRDDSDLPDEEWKQYHESLWVSNHGRIQWMKNSGNLGVKHFPETSNSKGYLYVNVFPNKPKGVHVLVGELFFIGPRPRNWRKWDHKDYKRKQYNHINNLRPVTDEENSVNTGRQKDFYIWRKSTPEERILCRSQSEAAREYNFDIGALNAVLHKRANKHGSVRKTVAGWCAAWASEVE